MTFFFFFLFLQKNYANSTYDKKWNVSDQQVVMKMLPLYGFIQLIDDGLQNSFVSGDVWSMKASSEER